MSAPGHQGTIVSELPISIFGGRELEPPRSATDRTEPTRVATAAAPRGALEKLGEPALVERARTSAEAFAELYRRHYSAIAGYIYRRIGDAGIAEDLTADVFLAALRSLRSYRWRGIGWRSWLYAIATNACHRWLRRNRRRIRTQGTVSVDPPWNPGDGGTAIEAKLARRAMLALSPKLQAVAALHYLEGLSVEAVAAILRVRVGTVKSRLSRAREALREELLRGR